MRATIACFILTATLVSFGFAQDHAVPSISPIEPKGELKISKFFGNATHPTLKIERMHRGIDIPASVGTAVLATADGVVVESGKNTAEGLFVQLKHASGYKTRYTHLSRVAVKKGQEVKRSTCIAYTGATGQSKGSHLHYEVIREGRYEDPTKFIAAH